MITVGPFLKWEGGKIDMARRILEKFPLETIDTLRIPFLGGGSVLLAFLQSEAKYQKVIASDLNTDLIDVWKAVQADPEKLFKQIQQMAVSQRAYYDIRKSYNKSRNPAMFMYLNRCCLKGLYRVSKDGDFNVTWGGRQKYELFSLKQLKRVSELIKDVKFIDCDFATALKDVKKEDFVYLDPPSNTLIGNNTLNGLPDARWTELFNTLETLLAKFILTGPNRCFMWDNFKSLKKFIISRIWAVDEILISSS